jgi:NADH-quinone oxidoreductase subunit N
MLSIPKVDFIAIAPELILTGTAFAIILWELITRTKNHMASAFLAVAGICGALVVTLRSAHLEISTFGDAVVLDPFASFFKVIFLFALLLTVTLSLKYIEERGSKDHSEYYALLMLATAGMMVMAIGREMITIFLGLELLSMSLYVLAGFFRNRTLASEASLKYFILGSFATGIMLFGMSYVYGVSGSTHLKVIAENISAHPETLADKALLIGMLMILVGFGFKISVVPFHQWTPDVYQGAPTPVAAFMSAGPKAAGLAALIRILFEAMPHMAGSWELPVALLAVMTMTVGNLAALAQRNVKRMLAYSSIAHVGYILIGLVAAVRGSADRALSAVMFYLLAYTFMNIGAFAILIYAAGKGEAGEDLDDFAGLSRTAPGAALAMLVFLFSLAGIPPTAGFAAKLSIFFAAIEGKYYWLVVIGILNSLVAAYYYLRLVVIMYMREPEGAHEERKFAPVLWAGIVIALAGSLILGVLPGSILQAAKDSIGILIS